MRVKGDDGPDKLRMGHGDGEIPCPREVLGAENLDSFHWRPQPEDWLGVSKNIFRFQVADLKNLGMNLLTWKGTKFALWRSEV